MPEDSALTPLRILLISNIDAPFVSNDVRILGGLGRVTFLHYRRRADLFRLLRLVVSSDVVVCWFVLGYATASVLIGRSIGTPTVLIAGGWDVASEPGLGYGAMLDRRRARKTRYALGHATQVLAVSDYTRDQVALWVSRDVRVVPNGVDTDFFKPLGVSTKRVVTVAGVDSEVRFRVKGLDIFLEVARRIPEVPFLLVGGHGPSWDRRIMDRAPANVRLLGRLGPSAIRQVYQTSHVYAQFSAHESFGVALAEAMACGCVPVASSRGGLPSLVGSTGYLVDYGDIDAAVSAVRNGLADEVAGTRARERIVAEFSLDRRRVELSRALEPVLSRGP